jgi:predicted nuclease with TOPRIM domain
MLEKNDKLTKQIEKQMAEIEQMNEYIAQIEHDKSACLQASESQDKAEVEKLSQKIEQLTKELSDRDQKYIQLMEKLKQTQDQFKAYEQN